jgi:DNA-binding MarR family transcriptional regulator
MPKTGETTDKTDDLARTLEAWSKVLQDMGSDLYKKAFANHGIAPLSLGQFRYFDLIARQPGVTPGELARTMGVARPTVANTLGGLQRRGLVRRSRSETDARVQKLYLSGKAQEIADYRASMYQRMASGLRKVLSQKECASLAGLLKKSLESLSGSEGAREESR